MTDGLDSLEAKAASKRRAAPPARTIPPSRHQPRQGLVAVPAPAAKPEAPSAASEALEDSLSAAENPATPAPTPTQPTRSQRAAASSQGQADKVTLWLTPGHQSFLDSVVIAGKQARPRVALSRSAVTRLALARLAEQMSEAEIVAALSGPVTHEGPGRKLR